MAACPDHDDNSSAIACLRCAASASNAAQGEVIASTIASERDAEGRRVAQGALQPQLPLRARERYKFIEEHARGGLGRIWRVRDRDLGRQIALKEILNPNPASRLRFRKEALTTARLAHPSIVSVHDAGSTEAGELFYTMDLLPGRTLTEGVNEARTPAARMALLPRMLPVVEAVAYAHSEGVLHRDLKPTNILIGKFGETIVIDWGLAKDKTSATEEDAIDGGPHEGGIAEPLTQTGAVVGTPAYMPLEQANGSELDERSDIYSLGACLYFVLTGSSPYPSTEGGSVLETVRTKEPVGLLELAPQIPKDLAAIVARAMARNPDSRYPDAQSLAADLNRFLTGQPVLCYRYPISERASRWVQRHRNVAIAALVALTLLGAGTLLAGVRESVLRNKAELERGRAQRSTLSLLEEQGRSELSSGHPQRAAVLIAEALRQAPDNLGLRFLLSQALRPVLTPRLRLVGHAKDVVSVAYSPDGRLIASGGDDPFINLWNATTGERVRSWPEPGGVDALAFSADGQFVAAAGIDNTVRVFSVDGIQTRTFQNNKAYRIAFTPDGGRLVVGTQSGEVQILDVQSGQLLHTLNQHSNRVHHLGFSNQGELVVSSWDRTVSVWNLATYARVRLISGQDSAGSSVAFSHDGKWVVVAEGDASMRLYDAVTWKPSHTIRMPPSALFASVWFSADDQTLLTTAQDGVVRVWHVSSGQLLASLDVIAEGKLFSSALGPTGTQLVTAGLSGSLTLWSLEGLHDFQVLPLGVLRDDVLPSVVGRSGNKAVTPTHDGTVVLWDLERQKQLLRFDAGVNPETIAFSEAAGGVVVSNISFSTKAATQFSLETGAPLWTTAHPRLVHNVAVSPDGLTYATACYDGAVRLLDARTGAILSTFAVSKARLSAVAFAPDRSQLAAADAFGRVYLVDAHQGSVTRSFQAHPTWIQDVEFSPDGKRLVTAGRMDHRVRVWDLQTLGQLLDLSTHVNNVTRASFSPDGRLLASSGVDHRAHLFDATTGHLLRSWTGPASSAEFTPDGRYLLTTGDNGYALRWNIEPDARSAEVLVPLVEAHSPWELVDGRLRLKSPPK